MLSLLAARPSSQFARMLYSHSSDFWCQRLGAQTGRGCLVRPDGTGRRALDAPWTPKAQHDILVQRSGYLTLTLNMDNEDVPRAKWPIVATSRRIKAMVGRNWTSRGYGKTTELTILALWEDGTVRFLDEIVKSADPMRIKAVIEDDSAWRMAVASDYVERIEFDRHPGDMPTSPLPRMKMMIRTADDTRSILALDYDGVLWHTLLPEYQYLENDTVIAMARVSIPSADSGVRRPGSGSSRVSDIGRILHITNVRAHRLNERIHTTTDTITLVTTESNERYLLDVMFSKIKRLGTVGTAHAIARLPVYFPIDNKGITDVIATYSHRDQSDSSTVPSSNIDDDITYLYPLAPYGVLKNPNDPRIAANIDDVASDHVQVILYRERPEEVLMPIIDQGLVGPTERVATYDDISELLRIAQFVNKWNGYYIPLMPNWMSMTIPFTGNYRNRPSAAKAIDKLVLTPSIGAIAHPFVGLRYGETYFLKPNGSVDMVTIINQKNRGLIKGPIVEVYDDEDRETYEYGVITLDLTEAIGERIEAMVHIDIAADPARRVVYGVGV